MYLLYSAIVEVFLGNVNILNLLSHPNVMDCIHKNE
jgi:hypothetical protein